jgi:hypothetical protein
MAFSLGMYKPASYLALGTGLDSDVGFGQGMRSGEKLAMIEAGF